MALNKLKLGTALSTQITEQNANIEQVDKFMTGGGTGKFSIGEPQRADRQGLSLGGALENRAIHFEDPEQRVTIRYANGYALEGYDISQGLIIGPVGGTGVLFISNQIWSCDVNTGSRIKRLV